MQINFEAIGFLLLVFVPMVSLVLSTAVPTDLQKDILFGGGLVLFFIFTPVIFCKVLVDMPHEGLFVAILYTAYFQGSLGFIDLMIWSLSSLDEIDGVALL